MQDGAVESGAPGGVGIDVQWIHVTAQPVDQSEVGARCVAQAEVGCAVRNLVRVRSALTRRAAMAVGTGKGGDANRRQQVARCPVAQAGLGDAAGSPVTLLVHRPAPTPPRNSPL